MNKNIIKYLVIGVIGVGILVFGNLGRKSGLWRPSPTEAITTSPSASASPSNSQVPRPGGTTQIKPPECSLSGELAFIQPKLFQNKNAYLSYSNIPDKQDFIRWAISPADNVNVGPNMFAGLTIPDGRDSITIAFTDGQPKYKAYTLTASVDYTVLINGDVKVLNVKCLGETKVSIGY